MSVRSVAVALVVTATVVVAGCAPDRPPRLDAAAAADVWPGQAMPLPLTAGDCAIGFARLVEAKGRRGRTIGGAGPDSSLGRVPVGAIGDWVVQTQGHEILLIENGRPVSACGESGMLERPALQVPPAGTPLFTDADLRAVVQSREAGVAVYVWSPHMPLSADGYSELVAAAERRGVSVVPVLFAQSDTGFARREATRAGMPESALRTLASAELLLRDAQVHAPSVIVFRGREASPVMPGYRNAEGYGRWLDAVLSRDPPSGRDP